MESSVHDASYGGDTSHAHPSVPGPCSGEYARDTCDRANVLLNCSESSTSMSVDGGGNVADPWRNSSDCFAGLFHFVNEAYDLGYRVGARTPSPTIAPHAHAPTERMDPANANGAHAHVRVPAETRTAPSRRRQRLRFSQPSYERAVQNNPLLRERYLQFSVAPDRFHQQRDGESGVSIADNNDHFDVFAVPVTMRH